MSKNLKIVKIDSKYCNYLRKFDDKVPYNYGSKELRPFIGVLFTIDKCEYFAPLSSPKEKHKKLKNKLDIIKIKNGELGVINFNNMLPVMNNNYEILDLNKKTTSKKEKNWLLLLSKQMRWITSNKISVYSKSKVLYGLYKNNLLPESVKSRCCNFILLELKCREYNKSN